MSQICRVTLPPQAFSSGFAVRNALARRIKPGRTGQATGFAEDSSDGTITQSPRAVIDDGRVFVETPLFGYQSFDDHF
jgi:hypothetical protein